MTKSFKVCGSFVKTNSCKIMGGFKAITEHCGYSSESFQRFEKCFKLSYNNYGLKLPLTSYIITLFGTKMCLFETGFSIMIILEFFAKNIKKYK